MSLGTTYGSWWRLDLRIWAWICFMWLRFVHLWRSESFSSRSLRLENHVGTRTATDACIVRSSYNDETGALTEHLFLLRMEKDIPCPLP